MAVVHSVSPYTSAHARNSATHKSDTKQTKDEQIRLQETKKNELKTMQDNWRLPSGNVGTMVHKGYLGMAEVDPAQAGALRNTVKDALLLAAEDTLRNMDPGERLMLLTENDMEKCLPFLKEFAWAFDNPNGYISARRNLLTLVQNLNQGKEPVGEESEAQKRRTHLKNKFEESLKQFLGTIDTRGKSSHLSAQMLGQPVGFESEHTRVRRDVHGNGQVGHDSVVASSFNGGGGGRQSEQDENDPEDDEEDDDIKLSLGAKRREGAPPAEAGVAANAPAPYFGGYNDYAVPEVGLFFPVMGCVNGFFSSLCFTKEPIECIIGALSVMYDYNEYFLQELANKMDCRANVMDQMITASERLKYIQQIAKRNASDYAADLNSALEATKQLVAGGVYPVNLATSTFTNHAGAAVNIWDFLTGQVAGSPKIFEPTDLHNGSLQNLAEFQTVTSQIERAIQNITVVWDFTAQTADNTLIFKDGTTVNFGKWLRDNQIVSLNTDLTALSVVDLSETLAERSAQLKTQDSKDMTQMQTLLGKLTNLGNAISSVIRSLRDLIAHMIQNL